MSEAADLRAQSERTWRRVSILYATIVALGVGYFLFRMPSQVSDNVGNLLQMQRATLWSLIEGQLSSKAFLRPLLWGQAKVLFDVSGNSFLIFKLFHVLQLGVVLVLFARLLAVKSLGDFAALPAALAVLIGLHTFNGTIREAFPVNTFMTILVTCTLAANFSYSRGGWWIDAAATLVTGYAAFTVETGLLVWVCLVAAYLVGFRGVSLKGVVGATLVLALYFVVRFGVMDVAVPALTERSSGFGFSAREPEELVRMFGDHPLRFYAYNIVSSALTVLFSEPRGGVWILTREALKGEVPTWLIVNVGASLLATSALAWCVARRSSRWRRWEFDHGDRLLLLFLAVLPANATISYPYTKDVVMSPAGVFYAAAIFVALRDLGNALTLRPIASAAFAAASAFALALGATWTIRAASLPYTVRYAAFVYRNDWATAIPWLDQQTPGWRNPGAERLVNALRSEVVRMKVPNPHFTPRWMDEYFDPY